MKKCYLCGANLTVDNQSQEHILLNSIGGRLKTKSIMCKQCNSRIGNQADSELSKQLNHFSNILLIKRERGKPASVKVKSRTSDKTYVVNCEGIPTIDKPIIHEKREGSILQLNIEARNIAEFRKILEGYKRKYPQLDIEELIEKAEEKELYINEPLGSNVNIGGPLANESIAKSAVEYFLYKKHNPDNIKSIIASLNQSTAHQYVEPIIPELLPYDIKKW